VILLQAVLVAREETAAAPRLGERGAVAAIVAPCAIMQPVPFTEGWNGRVRRR
jgi:hypothetical protein